MGNEMNIDDLTIGEAKKLAAMFGGDAKKPDLLSRYIGKKALIRDNKAGVFITTLEAVAGKEWVGGESRKVHYWEKAGAVEGIAETGIDVDNSRITVTTPASNGKELVQLCPVADEIYKQIMEATPWNPK